MGVSYNRLWKMQKLMSGSKKRRSRVSYNRLWKMLIDKNMKRIEMQYLTGISGNILARMGKNQYVSMETIEKICKKLDCTVDEMLEFTDDE